MKDLASKPICSMDRLNETWKKYEAECENASEEYKEAWRKGLRESMEKARIRYENTR